MRELLGEIRSEVAFNYNHELANILNDSATSDVPPVRELFCWYVGCYQYTGHPANAGENYGRCLKLDQEHLTMGTIDLDLRNHHPRRTAIHLILLPRKDQGKFPEFDQKEVKRALNQCDS